MLEVLQAFQDSQAAPAAPALTDDATMADKPAAIDSAPAAASASAPTIDSASKASVAAMMTSGAALQDAYMTSPRWKTTRALLDAHSAPAPGATPVAYASALARSFPFQLATLVARQAQHHARNVPLNFGRFVALTILQLIFGIAW